MIDCHVTLNKNFDLLARWLQFKCHIWVFIHDKFLHESMKEGYFQTSVYISINIDVKGQSWVK